jgi:hypothetical protein
VDQAVGREDDEAGVVEVAEVDEAPASGLAAAGGQQLVAVGAHRLVAVVAVGDVDALVGEDPRERGGAGRVADAVERVVGVVEVAVEHWSSEVAGRGLPGALGSENMPNTSSRWASHARMSLRRSAFGPESVRSWARTGPSPKRVSSTRPMKPLRVYCGPRW